MAFRLFKKHPEASRQGGNNGAGCAVCGQDVEKGNVAERVGKHICAKGHAEESKKETEKVDPKKQGGCCG